MVYFIKKIFSETGYTLVETMVAGAILLGVLIPAVMILAHVMMSQYSKDKITANNLARGEIEYIISTDHFQSYDKIHKVG